MYLNPHFFTLRGFRVLRQSISSYGLFAPVVIIGLILAGTIVPFLPLPDPLIELAAGFLFGAFEGFVIVWVAQMIASLAAFLLAKRLRGSVLKRFLGNKMWEGYRDFINDKGVLAVLVSRLTMSAPFNITSYFAGLTDMGWTKFALATAFGIIPESLLFSFVGSQLRILRSDLWLIFGSVAIVAVIGFATTFYLMTFRENASKK